MSQDVVFTEACYHNRLLNQWSNSVEHFSIHHSEKLRHWEAEPLTMMNTKGYLDHAGENKSEQTCASGRFLCHCLWRLSNLQECGLRTSMHHGTNITF
jgi:hypothetical protein